MKPDEPRLQAKHELEHAVPTVIHDPEQDMNALERWLRHAMENPVQFWGGVGAIAVVLVAVSLLAGGLDFGKGKTDEAWSKIDAAKTAAEKVEVAKEFSGTPAEQWTKLGAATEFYLQGFNDLPSNKDVALPTLKKALDLFAEVAKDAPADSPQARAAALGLARTYEARNELDKAKAQYEKVAGNAAWKGTAEAAEARRLAELVGTPEVKDFYKELYAYKAPEATLPGGGSLNLGSPFGGLPGMASPPGAVPGAGVIPGLGPASSLPGATLPGAGAGVPPIDLKNLPPPPPTPEPKADAKGKTLELLPPTTPAPKAETPAPAPKADEPAKKAELPGDPFTPAKK